MSGKISRRDFLKIGGVGAAAGLILTGCGSNARFVRRQTYYNMPEYTLPGTSTYYASTCLECPAGCGIIVRTTEGRAIKVEGNPSHPVNRGRTCSRGQTSVQGLYNPDRFPGALRQAQRGSGDMVDLPWEEGVAAIVEALQTSIPAELAFITGLAPDHLYELLFDLTESLGAPAPVRMTGLSMLEMRRTLIHASEQIFGIPALPHFNIAQSDVIFSFGAQFTETWLTPVSYSLAYGDNRQGIIGKRGYIVHFEPRMSMTAGNADEWIPIQPGSEALIAGMLAKLIQEQRGLETPLPFQNLIMEQVVQASGVSEEDLNRLARIFAGADQVLAIPGAQPMGHSNGLAAAEAILMLNGLVGSQESGGLSFPPEITLPTGYNAGNSLADMQTLVDRMNAGEVKTLFIHRANPVFDLPPQMGFESALQNVERVISFSSYPDETSLQADFILPDHTPLESWGYQRLPVGSQVLGISGVQPVVMPFRNTHSTADVILAAIQQVGGTLAADLPITDEVAYIQSKIIPLNAQAGFYSAPEDATFWSLWQQAGGWWQNDPSLRTPDFDSGLFQPGAGWEQAQFADRDDYPFHLTVYPQQHLSDGRGANRPWLIETPDPMTTAMWDTWVEINTETGHELGLENDDIVRVISPAGEITALVYLYPAIRPDVVAMPTGLGHTYFGRFGTGFGANPFKLLPTRQNEAGDLAFASTMVKIEPTGRHKKLARKESIDGVYGEEEG